MTRLVFLPNLAADLELMQGTAFAPSTRLLAECESRGQQWLHDLAQALPKGIELVDLSTATGAMGQAFCPTPTALATLRAAGARISDAPTFAVLRQVNHRSFLSDLSIDGTLPGARFVTSTQDLDRTLTEPDQGHGFLLKRPFGFAGRMRKHVRQPLSAADRAWVEASMHDYGKGLQVEPFVERLADFAIHGILDVDGVCHLGRPTTQQLDRQGRWLRSRLTEEQELQDNESQTLLDTAANLAERLSARGYYGPFGIDAFRWRDRDGRQQFCPACDLNARYTMAFFCDDRLVCRMTRT